MLAYMGMLLEELKLEYEESFPSLATPCRSDMLDLGFVLSVPLLQFWLMHGDQSGHFYPGPLCAPHPL